MAKKTGKLRLVLDCRKSSRMCHDAPPVRLLISEGCGSFEVVAPDGVDLNDMETSGEASRTSTTRVTDFVSLRNLGAFLPSHTRCRLAPSGPSASFTEAESCKLTTWSTFAQALSPWDSLGACTFVKLRWSTR